MQKPLKFYQDYWGNISVAIVESGIQSSMADPSVQEPRTIVKGFKSGGRNNRSKRRGLDGTLRS